MLIQMGINHRAKSSLSKGLRKPFNIGALGKRCDFCPPGKTVRDRPAGGRFRAPSGTRADGFPPCAGGRHAWHLRCTLGTPLGARPSSRTATEVTDGGTHMETAKVDIRKLQLLNDRINQCLDALSQVRQSVHGLSHSQATPPLGIGAQAPGYIDPRFGFGASPVVPGFGGAQTAGWIGPGFAGGLAHTPFSPYAQNFSPYAQNPLAQMAQNPVYPQTEADVGANPLDGQ